MPSATGISSTALASMGSTGGLIGRSTATSLALRYDRDELLQVDQHRVLAVGELAVTEGFVQADVGRTAVAGEQLEAAYPRETLLDRAQQRGTDAPALQVGRHGQPADDAGLPVGPAAHRAHDAGAGDGLEYHLVGHRGPDPGQGLGLRRRPAG